MTKRPPDSRVPFGQAIEDRLDAISASTRRDIAIWITRLQRSAPGDAQVHGAILGGIATALLDEINKAAGGEPEQIRTAWAGFAEGYIEAQAEDAAADAEDAPPEAQP